MRPEECYLGNTLADFGIRRITYEIATIMTQSDIIEAFAQVYWSAIAKYNDHNRAMDDESLARKRFMSEFRHSLKWPIKHCGTLIPPKASLSALKIACDHDVDLHALQWKDQPNAEKLITGIKGRHIFVHEHEIPIVIMYERILRSKSLEEVKNILSSQSIVWITKEENKRLPQYKRSPNAYQEAGIEYESNPYADDWMERPWKRRS